MARRPLRNSVTSAAAGAFGIVAYGAATIEHNTLVIDNGIAVDNSVSPTSPASISANTVTGTTDYSVGIAVSGLATVDGNAISQVGTGIGISAAAGQTVVVTNNLLSGIPDDDSWGLWVHDTPASATVTVGGNRYATTFDNYIFLGYGDSAVNIDATGEYFDAAYDPILGVTGGTLASTGTLAQQFGFADKIIDAVDVAGLGLVRTKLGNVYVTPNSFRSDLGTSAPSIGRAVAVAGDGDTVNVEGGDYVETAQVVVNKNLTIVGTDGKAATTDSIGFDTTNSGDSKGWYLVTDGVTFNLSGLTLDGSGHKVFQAIRDYGSGTIDHVAFKNIQYNASGGDYAGTAIVVFGADSDVDVTGSTFSGIGRVGVLYFGDTAHRARSAATPTQARASAIGWTTRWKWAAARHATIAGNTITGNTGVASVDGSTSAGILVTTFYGAGTAATITGNHIYGNNTGVAVGYDESDTSSVTIDGNWFQNTAAALPPATKPAFGPAAHDQDSEQRSDRPGRGHHGRRQRHGRCRRRKPPSRLRLEHRQQHSHRLHGHRRQLRHQGSEHRGRGQPDVMARNNNFGPYVDPRSSRTTSTTTPTTPLAPKLTSAAR